MDPKSPTAAFELGERWYSDDDGRSFTRGTYWDAASPETKAMFVVTGIDRIRGAITLEKVRTT